MDRRLRVDEHEAVPQFVTKLLPDVIEYREYEWSRRRFFT